MAKRGYKARLKLKADMEAKMAEVLDAKGVDYVKVVEGLIIKVDEEYVALRAVVKKADYDVKDAVVEYDEKVAKAKAKAEAKAKKDAKRAAEKAAKAE